MSAPHFAENTKVAPEKSRGELEALLRKHGATQTVFATDDEASRLIVAFTLQRRQVRMVFPFVRPETISEAWKARYHHARAVPPQLPPMPQRYGFMSGQQREAKVIEEATQLERARWRQILLVIKAKLEVVSMGLSSAEREFLADISLPSGQTVHEAFAAHLERAYQIGSVEPIARLLLPPATRGPAAIDADLEEPRS